MVKRILLQFCVLTLGAILLGGCSFFHYEKCGWEELATAHMSPDCMASATRHKVAKPASSLPTPVKKMGFSVALPKDEEWYVVRNTQTAVAIAKKGEHSDESYVIYVQGSKLPDLATPQAFQQYVDKQRAENTDPKRFTILANEETPIENGLQGALCLRYQTTVIDRHAEVAPSKYKTMHTTSVALACRSPYDVHLAVTLVYSQRYHPGNEDKTLSAEFAKIAATLHFEPVTEATKDGQLKDER